MVAQYSVIYQKMTVCLKEKEIINLKFTERWKRKIGECFMFKFWNSPIGALCFFWPALFGSLRFTCNCLIYEFYTSTKWWRGNIFTAVCVCLAVNKIPAKRMHQFQCSFFKMNVHCTDSDPIKIRDPGSKGKVTVIKNTSENIKKNC